MWGTKKESFKSRDEDVRDERKLRLMSDERHSLICELKLVGCIRSRLDGSWKF